MTRWYTTGQAARYLGVSRQTVRNWIRLEMVPGVMRTPTGQFKVPAEWVHAQLPEPVQPPRRRIVDLGLGASASSAGPL